MINIFKSIPRIFSFSGKTSWAWYLILPALVLNNGCQSKQKPVLTPAVASEAIKAPVPDTTTKKVTPPPDTLAKAEAKKLAPDSLATAKPVAKDPPGWPVKMPNALPGAILPEKRIVAFYGNPLSKRMGILGELEPEQMFAQLDKEVAAWEKADPSTPVQPAFHVIVVTAQGEPGKGAKYRLRMSDHVAEKVIGWAEQKGAIVFLDLQIGRSTLQEEIPRLEPFLKLPNVHLGIDAEFAMNSTGVPGRRVGSYDAADINYATSFLASLVDKYQIPPKLLIVHRFTQRMITNYKNIKLDPRYQIVMHMDGWGNQVLKKDTYRAYIQKEPVQYTGFKIFYKNDKRKPGWRIMTPEDVLKLNPKPLYIQYQ
ncbi:hypothetical protein [Adhaeribacter rhizoryzae]|uniref:hypothetical protein n=1 Tax=Adhaeribacter rhizoryzae TaxID=2607907 RepID=UPI001CC1EDDE|nr:hypothetical protein [Adhaeribacter rhizoryzae]